MTRQDIFNALVKEARSASQTGAKIPYIHEERLRVDIGDVTFRANDDGVYIGFLPHATSSLSPVTLEVALEKMRALLAVPTSRS